MRCPLHVRTMTRKAASGAAKLVSCCPTVDMSEVFGPLFRDPPLVSGERWTLLIFQYTPHQEERIITSRNTSNIAVPESLRREGRGLESAHHYLGHGGTWERIVCKGLSMYVC